MRSLVLGLAAALLAFGPQMAMADEVKAAAKTYKVGVSGMT